MLLSWACRATPTVAPTQPGKHGSHVQCGPRLEVMKGSHVMTMKSYFESLLVIWGLLIMYTSSTQLFNTLTRALVRVSFRLSKISNVLYPSRKATRAIHHRLRTVTDVCVSSFCSCPSGTSSDSALELFQRQEHMTMMSSCTLAVELLQLLILWASNANSAKCLR